MLTLSPASAQRNAPTTGVGAVHPKFQPAPQKVAPSVIQQGVGSETKSSNRNSVNPDPSCQPGFAERPSSPYSVNGAGYPIYPGPNVPLPAQGSYYANPYGYYNNPYDPYNYSNQGYNNGGYANPGYANPGYYNPGNYNGSSNYQPSSNPYGPTYPAFRGYNQGNRP